MEYGIKHLGIIPDGNRRYARKALKNPLQGHDAGIKKISEVLQWCREAGIKELTLYTFSVQNFRRSRIEISYLFNLLRKAFEKIKKENWVHKHKVKVRFLGRLELFPKDMQEMCKEIEEMTEGYDEYHFNLAMGYGGREEIVDAVNKMLKKGIKKIDEEIFKNYLYNDSEPELIIRTSGEYRTSNFLVYQGIYAEWCFVQHTWPEFSKRDFTKCLEEYAKRKRRFGK